MGRDDDRIDGRLQLGEGVPDRVDRVGVDHEPVGRDPRLAEVLQRRHADDSKKRP